MAEKYISDINNTKKVTELIKKLTKMAGISSAEYSVSQYLKELLEPYCTETKIDNFGNVIGFIKKDNSKKTLMFEAHIDRIGLMITRICEDGTLEFTNIGGVDERILQACEVCVLGKKNIPGIIYSINENNEKNPTIDEMRINTFVPQKDLEENVSIGDTVLISSEFTQLQNNQFSSGAMDNRAGIASIIEALSKIDKEKLRYNIAVLFSTQEELGLHGAYTGAYSIKADAAIVVDVTHGTTPDSKDETGVFPLGCGAVICRGPNFDYDYSKQLIDISQKKKIPHLIEVASGPSGTSAWAIQITGGGMRSMLVSIPLKYMHTNVETLDIKDVDAVAALLTAAAEGGVIIA